MTAEEPFLDNKVEVVRFKGDNLVQFNRRRGAMVEVQTSVKIINSFSARIPVHSFADCKTRDEVCYVDRRDLGAPIQSQKQGAKQRHFIDAHGVVIKGHSAIDDNDATVFCRGDPVFICDFKLAPIPATTIHVVNFRSGKSASIEVSDVLWMPTHLANGNNYWTVFGQKRDILVSRGIVQNPIRGSTRFDSVSSNNSTKSVPLLKNLRTDDKRKFWAEQLCVLLHRPHDDLRTSIGVMEMPKQIITSAHPSSVTSKISPATCAKSLRPKPPDTLRSVFKVSSPSPRSATSMTRKSLSLQTNPNCKNDFSVGTLKNRSLQTNPMPWFFQLADGDNTDSSQPSKPWYPNGSNHSNCSRVNSSGPQMEILAPGQGSDTAPHTHLNETSSPGHSTAALNQWPPLQSIALNQPVPLLVRLDVQINQGGNDKLRAASDNITQSRW